MLHENVELHIPEFEDNPFTKGMIPLFIATRLGNLAGFGEGMEIRANVDRQKPKLHGPVLVYHQDTVKIFGDQIPKGAQADIAVDQVREGLFRISFKEEVMDPALLLSLKGDILSEIERAKDRDPHFFQLSEDERSVLEARAKRPSIIARFIKRLIH